MVPFLVPGLSASSGGHTSSVKVAPSAQWQKVPKPIDRFGLTNLCVVVKGISVEVGVLFPNGNDLILYEAASGGNRT